MTKILLCDPVGEPSASAKTSVPLAWSPEKRVGTLFNNHVSSHRVWKRLEELVGDRMTTLPVSVHAKENTFAPAPENIIDDVIAGADFALVGVGA